MIAGANASAAEARHQLLHALSRPDMRVERLAGNDIGALARAESNALTGRAVLDTDLAARDENVSLRLLLHVDGVERAAHGGDRVRRQHLEAAAPAGRHVDENGAAGHVELVLVDKAILGAIFRLDFESAAAAQHLPGGIGQRRDLASGDGLRPYRDCGKQTRGSYGQD